MQIAYGRKTVECERARTLERALPSATVKPASTLGGILKGAKPADLASHRLPTVVWGDNAAIFFRAAGAARGAGGLRA